jgi:hypothetical protein
MIHAHGKNLNIKVENSYIIQEQAILKTAIQAFSVASGAQLKVVGTEIKEAGIEIDALVQVTFRSGQQQFYVEIKGELRQAALSSLLSKFGKDKDKWLLVSKYIPGPLKDDLRKNGVNYLEATGNCYVNTGNIYLYINDREVKQTRQTPEGKLWKATGLKLLFVLIQDPDLIGASYRRLSELAGIALGSISPLLDELRNEGYIKKEDVTGKEILINRSRLIASWAELYPVVLRPKLRMGAFRFLREEQAGTWKDIQVEGIYWGGEPGGELYTHHLIPEEFTLYTARQANELVTLLKIVPDEKGKVMVFQKFWHDWSGSTSVQGAAPTLLVYAELINSTDSRGWEVAEKIKNNYLNG